MALSERINALSAQLYPVGIPERAEQVTLEDNEHTGAHEHTKNIKTYELGNTDIVLPPVCYDIERFHRKHINADTDEDFQALVADYSMICKKYNYDEYTMERLVAAINDIERCTKARWNRSGSASEV